MWKCDRLSLNVSSCLLHPGQPPLLATAQSPQPPTSVSGSGGQIVGAIYPPSSSVTMATGVVSMAAVPPSVVYSVSSTSNSSPHILPKHITPTVVTHPHPDRSADRHLPDRHADRQAELQTISSSSSAAPPTGSVVSIRPCSPLQIQAPGMTPCTFFIQHKTCLLL